MAICTHRQIRWAWKWQRHLAPTPWHQVSLSSSVLPWKHFCQSLTVTWQQDTNFAFLLSGPYACGNTACYMMSREIKKHWFNLPDQYQVGDEAAVYDLSTKYILSIYTRKAVVILDMSNLWNFRFFVAESSGVFGFLAMGFWGVCSIAWADLTQSLTDLFVPSAVWRGKLWESRLLEVSTWPIFSPADT